MLRQVESSFSKDYLRHTVDLHNIKTFLRLRTLQEPLSKLEERICCEGFIGKKELVRLYPRELPEFIRALGCVRRSDGECIDYAGPLKDAIGNIEEKRSFASFEKAQGDFLMLFLRKARYFGFGPEPLLAYYFAKANEISLVRLVAMAKLNNLPAETVKERLNISYA